MIRTKAIQTLTFAMLLAFACSIGYGQTVRSAIINSTTKQITISGTELLPTSGTPAVYLDGELLTLVSYTTTEIVADLPAGLPAASARSSHIGCLVAS